MTSQRTGDFLVAPLDPFHLSRAFSVPWELTSVVRLGLGSASALEESNHHPPTASPRLSPSGRDKSNLGEPFPGTPLPSLCSGHCSFLHPPAWDVSLPTSRAHFFVNRLFKYIYMAVLRLHCRGGLSLAVKSRGHSLLALLGPLIAMASLAEKPRL